MYEFITKVRANKIMIANLNFMANLWNLGLHEAAVRLCHTGGGQKKLTHKVGSDPYLFKLFFGYWPTKESLRAQF